MNFKNLHQNVKYRMAIIFISTMQSNMVFPFMSIYFAKNIGLVQTSIFMSAAIIISFIASIWGGDLSDKIGRKKIMVTSEYMKFFTFASFALTNSPWLEAPYITLIFFFLYNISSGLYSPASEAMLLDVSTPEERKYIYAIIYWISNLSIAIGGAAGAFLFQNYLFYLFSGLTIVSIVTWFITWFVITETHFPLQNRASNFSSNKKTKEFKSLLANYKTVASDRLFLFFVLSGLLLFSLESHLVNFISIRLAEQVISAPVSPFNINVTGVELLGFLRVENTVLVILFSLFVLKIIKKFKEKNLILIGFGLYIIGYSVISYSNSPTVLFIVMAIAVVGEVIAFPIHQTYLGDIIPDSSRSSYLALNRIALKGSGLIGTLFIMLASFLPYSIISWFVWCSGAVAFILLYKILPSIYKRRMEREKNILESNIN